MNLLRDRGDERVFDGCYIPVPSSGRIVAIIFDAFRTATEEAVGRRKRVDDPRVLSGIIFVNRIGLRWRDAPREDGPAKTLYNRWKRWSDKGIFIRMVEGLATPRAPERKTIMIDAT